MMRRYPAYKASGVDWLGEVPEGWTAVPLRRVIRKIESGTSVNAIDRPAVEEEVAVLKTSCVYTGEFDISENKVVVADEIVRASCSVEAGTLIVSRMNTPDLVGAAGYVEQSNSNIYLPDRLWKITFSMLNGRFVHYWTQCPAYRDQVRVACAGTSASMQNLSQDEFKAFRLPLPPLPEQRAIAGFLDREVGKIDALVGEQRRLIALLAEKRQAVISHAVTKGLNPQAPRKPSGIHWLGDVPEGWEVVRFSRLIAIAEGQVDPEIEPYASMLLIAPNHIESGSGRLLEMQTAAEQGAESGKYIFDAGAVIYSKIRPALAKVVRSPVAGLCSADMYPLTSKGKLDHDYLAWLLLTPGFTAWATMESDRVAMPKINREKLNELMLPVPPLDGQRAIAAYIRAQTAQLDALTTTSEAAISLLQERRAALISAAVTGKIDVRALAATD